MANRRAARRRSPWAVRGRLAWLGVAAASLLAQPALATDLVGHIELAPLILSDVGDPDVVMPSDDGPLYPYVEPSSLRFRIRVAPGSAVAFRAPQETVVLDLGADPEPGRVRALVVGTPIELRNPHADDWEVTVRADLPPLEVPAGGRAAVPLEAIGQVGRVELYATQSDWTSVIDLIAPVERVGQTRRDGPGRLSMILEDVIAPPEPAESDDGRTQELPPSGRFLLMLLLDGNQVCPGDHDGPDCGWTLEARLEAGRYVLPAIQLGRQDLYGSSEAP